MIVFDQLKKNDPHLRLLTLAVLVGMAVLVTGLWWVQIISYRHYNENQKAQSFRTVRIPAIRGKIVDRHGRALAENQPSYNVILYLDDLREEFKKEWNRLRGSRNLRLNLAQRRMLEGAARYRVFSNTVWQVSRALQMPIDKGYGDFMKHYTNQLALPMTLVENLTEQQVARFLEGSANPPGVDLEIQPTRYYPYGTLAAHILGFLVADNRSMEGEVADFNFRLSDYKGRVGIEADFDSELRGKAGVKSVLVNSLGYRQSENIWLPAEPGKNVVLTIDGEIQRAAEVALQSAEIKGGGPVHGAVVVLDPHSGDVLAIASAPTFNPNAFIPRITDVEWKRLSDETQKPQVNRAMQENYAPGSIFKLVTGLAILEHGIDPEERIYNPGFIRVPGRNRAIEDLAKEGYYDFKHGFIKSSNTYFITNGMKAGIEAIVGLASSLHLGERTGLLSSQETAGAFPKLAQVRRGWIAPDTAYICIGQGKMAVTPLQMAVMVAAIANGGKVLWPRLVQRIEPQEAQGDDLAIEFPPKPPRDYLRVRASSLAVTRDAMLADVEAGGTGKAALVTGMQIGGKTGTAQITDPRGNVVGHTTWFASCAPFENPRWVVVVMVEEGASGGTTCAPIAGQIYRTIRNLDTGGNPLASRN
ncbi:MAG TPA: penicillin-binding transpeptidase domain-containing protein [Candidatus Saccharimonadales bacterium]|nr:penicillin-binding transpeptidase domain-containing protein [Candidatus Saccharimonadales bacterium]